MATGLFKNAKVSGATSLTTLYTTPSTANMPLFTQFSLQTSITLKIYMSM